MTTAVQAPLVILIIVGITLGASQDVVLIPDCTNNMAVCPGVSMSYTCTIAGAAEVQWIAEPFLNETSPGQYTLLNGASTVGTIDNDFTPFVTILHISVNPFISALTINGSAVQTSVTVRCLAVGTGREERSQYIIADNVEPVSDLVVKEISGDLQRGAVMVTFERSPSFDIDRYIIVNCMDNTCSQVVIDDAGSRAVVMTSSSYGGVSHNVSVCAVNRCGFESVVKTAQIEVAAVKGYAALIVVFPFTAGALVGVTIGFIVYCICQKWCCKLKKEIEQK